MATSRDRSSRDADSKAERSATRETPHSKRNTDTKATHDNGLSRSTLRAHWVSSPDEQEDRAGETLATRNHDVIRHWAEERGGTPATVPETEHSDHLGVLRINFPNYGGQSLRDVSWDEWFRTFDDRNLVFLFQEHQKAGNQSNFFQLDSPDREDA